MFRTNAVSASVAALAMAGLAANSPTAPSATATMASARKRRLPGRNRSAKRVEWKCREIPGTFKASPRFWSWGTTARKIQERRPTGTPRAAPHRAWREIRAKYKA